MAMGCLLRSKPMVVWTTSNCPARICAGPPCQASTTSVPVFFLSSTLLGLVRLGGGACLYRGGKV